MKRLLIKQYIGKLPIPQRGVKIPKDLMAELAGLVRKKTTWSEEEEERLTWLVKELSKSTIHYTELVIPTIIVYNSHLTNH